MTAAASLSGDIAAHSPAAAWRRALPLWVVVVAWIGYWYRDTVVAMWGIWSTSDTYAHGMFVAPIALWLIWRRRQDLAVLTPKACPWVLVAMALVAAVWLVADLVAVNAATQFAFVALLILSVPAIFGMEVARRVAFPLIFLLFAVPFGDFMLDPLMEGTADFTVAALRLTGIPVYREGLKFSIPTGNWSVVEACSGVRYLIASFMVGSLFAYLNYQSWKRRFVFMVVSLLVPIVANWLRAYLLVMIGHVFGNEYAEGFVHLVYGWVFFGFVIMVLFLIGMRWAEPQEQPAEGQAASRATTLAMPVAMTALPAVALTAVAALLVTASPHAAERVLQAIERSDPVMLASVDRPAGGWTLVDGNARRDLPGWKPSFQNPSAERIQWFARDDQVVGMYVAYYRQQGYDRKLVSSSNRLVSSQNNEWARTASGTRSVELAGQAFDVRTAELRGGWLLATAGQQRLHVWQVYWVNDRWIASDSVAKLHGALARLLGRGDESAVVVLFTPREAGGRPEQTLLDFLAANFGAIRASLEATRQATPLAPVAIRSEPKND